MRHAADDAYHFVGLVRLPFLLGFIYRIQRFQVVVGFAGSGIHPRPPVRPRHQVVQGSLFRGGTLFRWGMSESFGARLRFFRVGGVFLPSSLRAGKCRFFRGRQLCSS